MWESFARQANPIMRTLFGDYLDDFIEFVQIAPRSFIYVLILLFVIVPGAI